MKIHTLAIGLALAASMPAAEWDQTWQLRKSETAGMAEFRIERRKPGSRHSTSNDVPLSRFRGLNISANGPAKFEYVGDAGRLICDGQMLNNRGLGSFEFRANPQYSAELVKLGYEAPQEERLFDMLMMDVSLEYARGVKSAGLGATTKELIEMRIHGVTLQYIADIRSSGYTDLRAKDYVEMRIHGVKPEFVKELKAAGYSVPARQIVEMRIHGVDSAYMQALRNYGLKPEPKDMIELRIHGATPEYLKDMKEAGFGELRSKEIVEMRIHGVSPEFVKETKALGYQCSARQLVEMRIHGVDGNYLRKLRDSGLKNLTPEKVVQLKIHGVD